MSADGFTADDLVGAIARRRKMEPEHRRTGQPVRRNSKLRGRHEGAFWTPMDPKMRSVMLLAAERLAWARKPRGRACPKGHSYSAHAIGVLRVLLRMVDYKTGRLEPTIRTIAERAKLCRDTVVRAMKTLKAWGFLDWFRRYVDVGNPGIRGPQVKQTSNAYKVKLPPEAARLVSKTAEFAPIPEDAMAAEAEHAAQRRQYQLDDPTDPLGVALSRLDPKNRERESGGRSQSGPEQI